MAAPNEHPRAGPKYRNAVGWSTNAIKPICTDVETVENQAPAMQAMQMGADYARSRHQFGRAIGSFQAIKHMCVDMLLEAQSAVSAARHVAASFDAAEPDRLAVTRQLEAAGIKTERTKSPSHVMHYSRTAASCMKSSRRVQA